MAAGMWFTVTIPTECEENKLKNESHSMPNIVITDDQEISWMCVDKCDRTCAAGESASIGKVRTTNFEYVVNEGSFSFSLFFFF